MKRIGFGQVEPNHLSAQRTGQIYAQLPAHVKKASGDSVATADTISILENGQFVKYDYAHGEVNYSGKGEWMLVFNEVKLYDDRFRESYKDFAMIAENYVPAGASISHGGVGPFDGQMYPRVLKTNVGDIYTTNTLEKGNTSGKKEIETETLAVGDLLQPNATGYLKKATGELNTLTGMVWQVVKVYTLADGQEAVKIMRIK